jgi:hypothetical protein
VAAGDGGGPKAMVSCYHPRMEATFRLPRRASYADYLAVEQNRITAMNSSMA